MSLNKKFQASIGDSWKSATPGICVQAYHQGKKVLDVGFGETYKYYDFASLTKILFTVSAFMFEYDKRSYRLTDPISKFVSWYPEESPWRIKDLLSHSAGLTWWYPFYQKLHRQKKSKIDSNQSRKVSREISPEDFWREFEGILRRKILLDYRKSPSIYNLKNPPSAVYSDLDFFLLGCVLESVTGSTLYEIWSQIRTQMGLKNTDFHRGNLALHNLKQYAPTENDRKWRHKILRGEVHDQNAWALGGVAPQAGLFGTISDLSLWGLHLRKAINGESSAKFASAQTVKKFTTRAISRKQGDWALGFMMPSRQSSSAGSIFSPRSVGHTGFTGTSLWFDPVRDLLVTILSNRIHPTVDNIEIRSLRPKIHDWIAEELSSV